MRSSFPSPVTSAIANFARLIRNVLAPAVSHTDSENESPSALGSRTVIRRLASPTGSWTRAICDLPFPLKSPLAATPEPTGLTDLAGFRGGIGVGAGVGDEGEGLGEVGLEEMVAEAPGVGLAEDALELGLILVGCQDVVQGVGEVLIDGKTVAR